MEVEKSAEKSKKECRELKAEIERLKKERDAVIMAHYYQPEEIQDIADHLGDSLALARLATTLPNKVIVLCGVHFMAETAKILCPEKTVLCPDPEAGCSLADSCPAPEFEKFIKEHPGHTVISYVNTSAAVKALTDVVVTSGNAHRIVESFPKDEKIIFGPDRNLGNYINSVTGRSMVLWNGACHVHEKFSLEKILELKKEHPQALVLAHPECPRHILLVADKIGSTAVLLDFTKKSDKKEFIVATESGILHEMRKASPEKTFIAAPPADSTCACNECSFMKLNTLEKVYKSLLEMQPQVEVDEDIIEKARRPIERMLELS
ncbi:MAG: quinolinate synthase NadA [Bacteroidales bacterium]|nr:quinolinate synthase NadA [Bacteroidales bacterium]